MLCVFWGDEVKCRIENWTGGKLWEVVGGKVGILEPQRFSDLPTIAPCLFMPSVWPVLVCSEDAGVCWTGPGIVMVVFSQQIYAMPWSKVCIRS